MAAPIGATAWWMLVDDVSPAQALNTPIPYALAAIAWFVATPIYLAVRFRVRGRLWPLLALATAGAAPFAGYALIYFLTPRDIFAACLIFSTAWTATLTFWVFLRVIVRLARIDHPDLVS